MKVYLRNAVGLLFLSSILFVFSKKDVNAQEKHQVSVNNNFFDPVNLTIQPGDTVVWVNSSGSHNVNGSTTAYPSNPESFGNTVGSNWTYSFVFNTTGSYEYQCDPHLSFGMTGSVTVQGISASIDQIVSSLSFYPNPVNDYLYIESSSSGTGMVVLTVYDITGTMVFQGDILTGVDSKIDFSSFQKGFYFIQYTKGRNTETVAVVKR